jgi:hypothetical protein
MKKLMMVFAMTLWVSAAAAPAFAADGDSDERPAPSTEPGPLDDAWAWLEELLGGDSGN